MYKIWQFFVRASAFIGKELVEVIRQTPLILTLVLGPFLILLLFGIGYTNEARPLRTIFILEEDNVSLRQQIEENVANIGPQLVYLGITNSRDAAVAELNQGRADLIVSIPSDALTMIENNRQVTIHLYHNEIDPYQVAYIESFGSIYVEAINERLLQSVAVQ
jgi:ABC-2 type transport system permease protein